MYHKPHVKFGFAVFEVFHYKSHIIIHLKLRSLDNRGVTVMIFVNTGFHNLDKKIEVSFFFNRVSLMEFIDLKPSLKTCKIVGKVKYAG